MSPIFNESIALGAPINRLANFIGVEIFALSHGLMLHILNYLPKYEKIFSH